MTSRIVELAPRLGHSGQTPNGVGTRRVLTCCKTAPHLYQWDVCGLTMIRLVDEESIPNVRWVRWRLYLDPMIPLLETQYMRDDIDYPLILRSQYTPGESIETTIRRQALMERDNLMLATAYGVPA